MVMPRGGALSWSPTPDTAAAAANDDDDDDDDEEEDVSTLSLL